MNIIKNILKWGGITLLAIFLLSYLFGDTKSENNSSKETSIAETETIKNKPIYSPTEEERNTLATTYCEQRENSSRTFAIPAKSGTEDDAQYNLSGGLSKKGSTLTIDDCRTIIDYLVWTKNKSFPLMNINIDNTIAGTYWIGMSVIELGASVGVPDDINKKNDGSGEIQQWIYYKGSRGIDGYYFYVQNGQLTSYQAL